MNKLKELRSICEKATKGPWFHWGNATIGSTPDYVETENTSLVECYTWSDQTNCIENAEHIATFNPTTVLALLDALEKAGEALEYYGDADNYKNGSGACPDVACVGGELIEYDYPAIGGDDRGENARQALTQIDEILKEMK